MLRLGCRTRCIIFALHLRRPKAASGCWRAAQDPRTVSLLKNWGPAISPPRTPSTACSPIPVTLNFSLPERYPPPGVNWFGMHIGLHPPHPASGASRFSPSSMLILCPEHLLEGHH
eukprot:EG_transcript_38479